MPYNAPVGGPEPAPYGSSAPPPASYPAPAAYAPSAPAPAAGGFANALDQPPPSNPPAQQQTYDKDPAVKYGGGGPVSNYATGPTSYGSPVSMDTKLDPRAVAILSQMDGFIVQQRVQLLEAITQGCIEQSNIYDVIDKNSGQKVMVIHEHSDDCSRCCCAPGNSLFAKFSYVSGGVEETQTPFMTMEREGCDCCFTGTCPKPCLCCWSCKPECSDAAYLYAGDLTGNPGEKKGSRDRTQLLGGSIQPVGGGGFKPVLQIMDRDGSGNPSMFAATRGPCLFGGIAEFFIDAPFGISIARPNMTVDEIHTLPLGDFASITKKKPSDFTGALKEAFTDSDTYEVIFHSKSITPQQKANVLSTMIHLDYMFFERDNDMCSYNADGSFTLTFFNCFCYGCVCPCSCTCGGSSSDE